MGLFTNPKTLIQSNPNYYREEIDDQEAVVRESMLQDEKGFTLIEIIAVLVIIGVLAAIALPKFMDLQTDARNRALEGALAEGMSTMSLSYASLLLSAGSATTPEIASRASSNAPASDDFTYTFGDDGRVSVAAKAGGVLGDYSGTKGKTWKK